MTKVFYIEDAIDVYNDYCSINNDNVIRTLEELRNDGYLPTYFMNYFLSYKDFLKEFNISEEEFNKARCNPWVGIETFRPSRL